MARIGVSNRVKLLSGGPTMTVVEVTVGAGQLLKCVWFDMDNSLQEYLFPAPVVQLVADSDGIGDSPETESGSGMGLRLPFGQVFGAIKKFKHENPGSSDKQIRHFVESSLLPSVDLLPATFREAAVTDLPYRRERLNPLEQALYEEQLVVGLHVLGHAASALDMTTYYYGNNRGNDNSDAFRHAYWNALMANDPEVGPNWAQRWGNAHEEGTLSNPPLEKEMDLFNNDVGRSIRSTGDSFVLAQNVKGAVDSGRMRRIASSGGPLVPTDSSGSVH